MVESNGSTAAARSSRALPSDGPLNLRVEYEQASREIILSFNLPDLSKKVLRRRGIDSRVDHVVEFVVECLHEACALVAEDTGRDRHDDRTSKGFLRWRRARNLIIERVAEEGPEGARAIDIENALQILFGDYTISFYSARDGIGQPDLSGSATKRSVVDEMQLQIAGIDGEGPTRLAILYEADELGLQRCAAGVLASTHDWHWMVTAFKRDEEEGLVGAGGEKPGRRHPSYDEQPVSDLPQLRPKEKRDKDFGADES